MNQAPRLHPDGRMQGFDAEFADLDQYIRVITARIWEGRQVEAIRDYYSDDCAVITPMGVTKGSQQVIDSTYATLAEFPDRRLLAEDVIQAGDAQSGYLSSHRIISTMTHQGAGRFGAATGRAIQVRTIADCVCRDNRVVHEWLVRDQGAIAVATGQSPQALAQRWLSAHGPLSTPAEPVSVPGGWRSPISTEPLAQKYAGQLEQLLIGRDGSLNLYDEAVCSLGPTQSVCYGRVQIRSFYQSVACSFHAPDFELQSLVFMPSCSLTARPPRVAMRWCLRGRHSGRGRYAAQPADKLEILGISHAEFLRVAGHWQVHREWTVIDEVAIWMQVLAVGDF